MSNTLTDVWELPTTPPVWQWSARLFAFGMASLALLWLLSWAYGIWWMDQPMSTGHVCVAMSLLFWLVWAWRHWSPRVLTAAMPIRLQWVGDWQNKSKSPWLTEQGQQPVHVRVLLDAGSHVLIHISDKGSISAFCVVSDKALSGPWRWRMLAGQPRGGRIQA